MRTLDNIVARGRLGVGRYVYLDTPRQTRRGRVVLSAEDGKHKIRNATGGKTHKSLLAFLKHWISTNRIPGRPGTKQQLAKLASKWSPTKKIYVKNGAKEISIRALQRANGITSMPGGKTSEIRNKPMWHARKPKHVDQRTRAFRRKVPRSVL
jgi:hypothetical protein